MHLLFRASGVTNRASFAVGLDTRTHAGYFLAEPSAHKSGRRYRWEEGKAPWDVEVAECPAWLDALLPRKRKAAAKTTKRLSEHSEAEIREALRHIPPDLPYSDWIAIGQALHSTSEPWAFDAFDSWSRAGATYSGNTSEKWGSFKGSGVTVGTLFHFARAGGWLPPIERAAGLPPRAPRPAEIPTLSVDEADIGAAVDTLERALVGAHVYQRAGVLVTPIRTPKKIKVGGIEREVGTCALQMVDEAWLAEPAARVTKWVRIKKDQITPQRPPQWALSALVARKRWRHLPCLLGHVRSPTLRVDGSVLSVAGFDLPSGLLADFDASLFPPVPSCPTAEQLLAAVDALREPFADFPFVAPSDESAAIALLLTVLVRPAIEGYVPIFAVRSTTPGTGKTLLANVAARVATGADSPVLLATSDKEEETKRLLSIAIAGDPIVLLDNLERALGNSALDAAVTSGSVRSRLLGGSTMVSAPWSAVVVATGNGLQVRGDTNRRTIPCDIDPVCERPEQRTGWRHPALLEWVLSERPRLVCAALTLLRAHAAASRPCPQALLLGSFEPWSRIVRASLVWCGLADPCEGQARLREDADPELLAWSTLLIAWEAHCGDREQAIAPLLTELHNPPPMVAASSAALLAALEGLCRDGRVSARYLGKIFRYRVGRILGGRRLIQGGRGEHGREWRVVRLTQADAG